METSAARPVLFSIPLVPGQTRVMISVTGRLLLYNEAASLCIVVACAYPAQDCAFVPMNLRSPRPIAQ